MPTSEELKLAPQFDGLAACVRVLVAEVAKGADEAKLRQRLALAAAADIRSKTSDPQLESLRNLMLVTVARTFGVSFGSIGGQ